MNRPRSQFLFLCLLAVFVLPACSSPITEAQGEESRFNLGKNDHYNQVSNGVLLRLAYDSHTNSFQGFVENTSAQDLRRIRVEVHLDSGVDLGPTYAVDLEPGERHNVAIAATFATFHGWTAVLKIG